MARKIHEDALGVTGAETIIGAGVTVIGNLISEADIIIDGNLTGSITTTSDVTLGINAQIKGPVRATNVIIAGSLEGNIQATGEATIRESGRVTGNIKAAGLAITPGGIFVGHNAIEEPPHLIRPDDEIAPPDSNRKS